MPLPTLSLEDLGWSDFFRSQLSSDESEQLNSQSLVPLRITNVHRIRLHARGTNCSHILVPIKNQNAANFAVGDWVLTDLITGHIQRVLERKTVLQRLVSRSKQPQLIAANIDTLFIVSSCNADFKTGWIDQFLAMASQADVTPVVILTKSDKTDNPISWIEQAKGLSPSLNVEALNAHDPAQVHRLEKWCQPGQSIAMIGSSGVGKSTILNTLCELDTATGAIRESDAQGRHTTTARSLHQTKPGGWLVDTPGIRALHLYEAEKGISRLFSEITELTEKCHFRDCTHNDEPGCALKVALSDRTLDLTRYKRWQKLLEDSRKLFDTPDETPLSRQEQRRISKALKQDQKRLKRKPDRS
ncbi:MAG: ribosome small subunit-dependent GTPase A [Halopseudomonas aestusnigri]